MEEKKVKLKASEALKMQNGEMPYIGGMSKNMMKHVHLQMRQPQLAEAFETSRDKYVTKSLLRLVPKTEPRYNDYVGFVESLGIDGRSKFLKEQKAKKK